MPVADRLSQLSDSQYRVARVRIGDRVARVRVPRDATPEQAVAIARRAVPKQERSFGSQLAETTAQRAAALVRGPGNLIDAPTEALAGAMRYIGAGGAKLGAGLFDAVGLDSAADAVRDNARTWDRALARPATVRSITESIVPPPTSTAGKIADFGAEVLGGAAMPKWMLPRSVQPQPKRATFPKPSRPNPKAPDMAVVQAGQRQKIPVRQPEAIPSLRGSMASAEARPYSGPYVRRTLDADRAAVQSRLGELGGGGNVQTEGYNLGKQIIDRGQTYIKQSGERASQLYTAADDLAGGQKVNPQRAIAAAQQEIAELSAAGKNQNSAQISYLEGLIDDLSKPGGFSIKEFQNLRSGARGNIKGNQALTVTDADRRLGNVVRAFTADAREQLPKLAADALDQADTFYSQRMDFIKGVLQPVIGTKGRSASPEQAAQRLQALARNRANYDVFNQFWTQAAGPALQSDFRATFTGNLGTTPRTGEFGLGRLASDINTIPENIRSTIYGKQASDLADLQTLARAKADTLSGLNNSRTGAVLARNVAQRTAPSLAGGYLLGGPVGAVAAPVAAEGVTAAHQLMKARSLLSPDFAKAIAQQAAPSLSDIAAPYLARGSVLASPRAAGLLDETLVSRLAAEDERERKKKKKKR